MCWVVEPWHKHASDWSWVSRPPPPWASNTVSAHRSFPLIARLVCRATADQRRLGQQSRAPSARPCRCPAARPPDGPGSRWHRRPADASHASLRTSLRGSVRVQIPGGAGALGRRHAGRSGARVQPLPKSTGAAARSPRLARRHRGSPGVRGRAAVDREARRGIVVGILRPEGQPGIGDDADAAPGRVANLEDGVQALERRRIAAQWTVPSVLNLVMAGAVPARTATACATSMLSIAKRGISSGSKPAITHGTLKSRAMNYPLRLGASDRADVAGQMKPSLALRLSRGRPSPQRNHLVRRVGREVRQTESLRLGECASNRRRGSSRSRRRRRPPDDRASPGRSRTASSGE